MKKGKRSLMREQLFDLDLHPGETTNVVQRPEVRATVEAQGEGKKESN